MGADGGSGDLAGPSLQIHPDTSLPTIILHETRVGGAGILRTALATLPRIAEAAPSIIADCPCESGCPSCIQSFVCPSLNEPLDMRLALVLLGELVPRVQTRSANVEPQHSM